MGVLRPNEGDKRKMPPSIGANGSENIIYDESQEQEYIRDTQLATNKKLQVPFSREYKKELLVEALNINPLFRNIENSLRNSDTSMMSSAMFRDIIIEEYMAIDGDPPSPVVTDGKPRIPFIDVSVLNRIVHVAKEVNIDTMQDGLVLTADGQVDKLASAVQQAQIAGVPLERVLANEKAIAAGIMRVSDAEDPLEKIANSILQNESEQYDLSKASYLTSESMDVLTTIYGKNFDFSKADVDTKEVMETILEVLHDQKGIDFFKEHPEFTKTILRNYIQKSEDASVVSKLLKANIEDDFDLTGFLESLTVKDFESGFYKEMLDESGNFNIEKARDRILELSENRAVAVSIVRLAAYGPDTPVEDLIVDEKSKRDDKKDVAKLLLGLSSVENEEVHDFLVLKLKTLKHKDGRPLYSGEIKSEKDLFRAIAYTGRELLGEENNPEWQLDEDEDGNLKFSPDHPILEYLKDLEKAEATYKAKDYVGLYEILSLKEGKEKREGKNVDQNEIDTDIEQIVQIIENIESTIQATQNYKTIKSVEQKEDASNGRFFSNQYHEIEMLLSEIQENNKENADLILKKIYIDTYRREFARTYGREANNDQIDFYGNFANATEISIIEKISTEKRSEDDSRKSLSGFLDGLVSYDEKGVRQIDFKKLAEIEEQTKNLKLDGLIKKSITDIEVVSERGYEEDKRNLNYFNDIVSSLKKVNTFDLYTGDQIDGNKLLTGKQREKEINKLVSTLSKIPSYYSSSKFFKLLITDNENIDYSIKDKIIDQLELNKANEVYNGKKISEHYVSGPKNIIGMIRERAHIAFREMDINRALRTKRGYSQIADEARKNTALVKTGNFIGGLYNKLHYRFTGISTRELINMRISSIINQREEFAKTEQEDDSDIKIYKRSFKGKSKAVFKEVKKIDIRPNISRTEDNKIENKDVEEHKVVDSSIIEDKNTEKENLTVPQAEIDGKIENELNKQFIEQKDPAQEVKSKKRRIINKELIKKIGGSAKGDADVQIYTTSKGKLEKAAKNGVAVSSQPKIYHSKRKTPILITKADIIKDNLAKKAFDEGLSIEDALRADYSVQLPNEKDINEIRPSVEDTNENRKAARLENREEAKRLREMRRRAFDEVRVSSQIDDIEEKLSTIKNQEGKEAEYYRHELEMREAKLVEIKKGNDEFLKSHPEDADLGMEYLDSINDAWKELRDRRAQKELEKGIITAENVKKIFNKGRNDDSTKEMAQKGPVKMKPRQTPFAFVPSEAVQEISQLSGEEKENVVNELISNVPVEPQKVNEVQTSSVQEQKGQQETPEINSIVEQIKEAENTTLEEKTESDLNQEKFKQEMEADRERLRISFGNIMSNIAKGVSGMVSTPPQAPKIEPNEVSPKEPINESNEKIQPPEESPKEEVVNELFAPVKAMEKQETQQQKQEPVQPNEIADKPQVEQAEKQENNEPKVEQPESVQEQPEEPKSAFEASLKVDNSNDQIEKKALEAMKKGVVGNGQNLQHAPVPITANNSQKSDGGR